MDSVAKTPARENPLDTLVGIDEAGRGPVLGPLVLCALRTRRARLSALEAMGVQDSKAFGSSASARRRRRELAERMKSEFDVFVEVAEAPLVDEWTSQGGLNRLEHELASKLLEAAAPFARAIADGEKLFAPLRQRFPTLEAVDRADQHELVVAAASIVAKDERDRRLEALFAEIAPELCPVRGGGYCNAATAAFLKSYVDKHRCLPPGLRHSFQWRVVAELKASMPKADAQLTLEALEV
jgi:ribonuclease HII